LALNSLHLELLESGHDSREKPTLSKREWTKAEDAEIMAGLAAGLTYVKIGQKLGRSAGAVRARYTRFLLDIPVGQRRIGRPPRRPWSPEESALAVDLHAAGLSGPEIAERLGRHRGTVHAHVQMAIADPKKRADLLARQKAHSERGHRIQREREAKVLGRPPGSVRVDPMLLQEREQRCALRPRDLTAALMGDPPVGYSALERREEES
jgi:hypothetical protein